MKDIEKNAIKRLRQETCPNTYMPDFDKEKELSIVEKGLQERDELKAQISKWIEMLSFEGCNSKEQVSAEMKIILGKE